MRKILIILLLPIIFTSSAHAFNLKNTLKFGSGFICGFLAHEASHIIAAEIKNINIKSYNFNWTHGISFNSKPSKTVALAGFAEQIISTEIILFKKAHKNSPFWKGYLAHNIIEPFMVTVVNGHCGKHNDLKLFSRAGGNKTIVGITINLHSLYTLYRLRN